MDVSGGPHNPLPHDPFGPSEVLGVVGRAWRMDPAWKEGRRCAKQGSLPNATRSAPESSGGVGPESELVRGLGSQIPKVLRDQERAVNGASGLDKNKDIFSR